MLFPAHANHPISPRSLPPHIHHREFYLPDALKPQTTRTTHKEYLCDVLALCSGGWMVGTDALLLRGLAFSSFILSSTTNRWITLLPEKNATQMDLGILSALGVTHRPLRCMFCGSSKHQGPSEWAVDWSRLGGGTKMIWNIFGWESQGNWETISWRAHHIIPITLPNQVELISFPNYGYFF